ncbi:MAG: hypothetical protein LBG52_00595 [Candidatus Peribacteria bacterium]|nr:hypothetical protein [Candidatus Peribacteria bacterium]
MAYSTTSTTAQPVVATLTGCSEVVTPFPQSLELLINGTGTFSFYDRANNP